MGAYKYIKGSFQQEYAERQALLKGRITEWRRDSSIKKIERPTNIARARELGYKAKPGVIVARVRVRRGLNKKQKPHGGRKPSKSGRFFAYAKSLQAIAEDRAARKFDNCEVLNSYFVGSDGTYKFFEVVLLDRSNPSITNDSMYSGIVAKRGRSYRGLTAAGSKHRGLLNKGFGTNKNRPSVRSNIRH